MGNTFKKVDPEDARLANLYYKPTGLYPHTEWTDVDVRKLISHHMVAPRYTGEEHASVNTEECPICFLWHPSLNKAKCCKTPICTECFLQVKRPHDVSSECPFCKRVPFKVVYIGPETDVERNAKHEEEEKVLKLQKEKLQHDDEEGRLADSSAAMSIGINPRDHGLPEDATVADILAHAASPEGRDAVPMEPPDEFYRNPPSNADHGFIRVAVPRRQVHVDRLMGMLGLTEDRPIGRTLRDSQQEAASHRGLMGMFDGARNHSNRRNDSRGARTRANFQREEYPAIYASGGNGLGSAPQWSLPREEGPRDIVSFLQQSIDHLSQYEDMMLNEAIRRSLTEDGGNRSTANNTTVAITQHSDEDDMMAAAMAMSLGQPEEE